MLIEPVGYHTLQHNKHKRPTPHRDVSARLILVLIESGSFRFENKSRNSKLVAPNHSVRGYVVMKYINMRSRDCFAMLAMTRKKDSDIVEVNFFDLDAVKGVKGDILFQLKSK